MTVLARPAEILAGAEAWGCLDVRQPEAADYLDVRRSEGGARLVVRRPKARDRAALEAMFLRCSPQTVYRRFHGLVKAFPTSYLAEVLAGMPAHYALVACAGSRVVALASCRLAEDDAGRGPSDDGGPAELGILIEDAWQRRGIGRELLRRLVGYTDSAGVTTLHAQMLYEQDWLVRLLREYGSGKSAFHRGVLAVTLRRSLAGQLPGPAWPAPPTRGPAWAVTESPDREAHLLVFLQVRKGVVGNPLELPLEPRGAWPSIRGHQLELVQSPCSQGPLAQRERVSLTR